MGASPLPTRKICITIGGTMDVSMPLAGVHAGSSVLTVLVFPLATFSYSLLPKEPSKK